MPQRFLKPGITTSEKWNAVSWPAQSLYIRLLTLVDDYGRYDARPSVIHGNCFAVWNDQHPNEQISVRDVSALCQQLADKGLLEIYETNTPEKKRFLQLSNWSERTRTKSRWPAPAACSHVAVSLPAACCQVAGNVRSACAPPPPSPSPSPSPAAASAPARAPGGQTQTEEKGPPSSPSPSAAFALSTAPSSTPPPVDEPAGGDQAADGAIPQVDEIVDFGRGGAAIPESFCRHYHAVCEEQHRWMRNGRLIDWRKEMVRWWTRDRASWDKRRPPPQAQEQPRQSVWDARVEECL